MTHARPVRSALPATGRLRRIAAQIAIAAVVAAPVPALANNYGESLAWQFMSPAERAAQIAMLDMIEKRRGGYYAAPIYNTTIARQYNCSISATATGNSGAQTALAIREPRVGRTVEQMTPDDASPFGQRQMRGTGGAKHQQPRGIDEQLEALGTAQ